MHACMHAGGTVALYAQLCRTMGFSPFGTFAKKDHEQVLNMKSGERGGIGLSMFFQLSAHCMSLISMCDFLITNALSSITVPASLPHGLLPHPPSHDGSKGAPDPRGAPAS